mmetsp:Transcript_5318/g.7197  ORF Transcript_5318/g.7197 Transcript_5318/m.7197 type:complete len:466 (+) Transcript_5318:635-2032(+)
MGGGHDGQQLLYLIHFLLEVLQVPVPQMVSIRKIIPATRQVVAVSIAGNQDSLGVNSVITGEVDPLRMPKLISHKGQVALTSQGHCEQSNHLVQCERTVDAVCGGLRGRHLVVHVGSHHPECKGLGSHKCLVVGLGVGDALLIVASVLQAERDVAQVPGVVIMPLFHHLHPLVRNGHLQSVVEPDPALRHRPAECWHAAHVLTDGHNVRVERVQHVIGQHQVAHAVYVRVQTKVLRVVACELVLQPVVSVHHGGDAVEPESVKLVLLHPPAQVGEEEAHGLPMGVVEQAGIPHPVVAALPRVKQPGVRPVERVDAVQRVVGRVTVHDVHEDLQAVGVRGVNEVLELIGGAAAGRHGEEVSDVVSEGAVECMLLHCHELDGIVPQLGGAWHHIAGKLQVGGNLGLRRRHAHVALVDAERLGLLGARELEGVGLLRRWVVVHTVEWDLAGGLHSHLDPRRDAVDPLA